MLQYFGSPLIEALAGSLSGNESATVQFGRHTQQQLAGCGLLGMHTFSLAVSKIIFDGELEFSSQFGHRLAVKTDDAANTENAPHEDIVSFVMLDTSGIALLISMLSI